MNQKVLKEQILKKQSVLCVGLDSDMQKIPKHLQKQKDAILTFNKAIIDATKEHCVAYKINTAFYEALGSKGWDILAQTEAYIPKTHFCIADAKRGDIPNTAKYYAQAFFETLKFDAITLSPFLGIDTVVPYLEYSEKQVIILAHTSNSGSSDFQRVPLKNSQERYFEYLVQKFSKEIAQDRLMFVFGATQSEELPAIRNLVPHHFLLIPGIGTQGGNLNQVITIGKQYPNFLINSSRSILYADSSEKFAQAAEQACQNFNLQIQPMFSNLSS